MSTLFGIGLGIGFGIAITTLFYQFFPKVEQKINQFVIQASYSALYGVSVAQIQVEKWRKQVISLVPSSFSPSPSSPSRSLIGIDQHGNLSKEENVVAYWCLFGTHHVWCPLSFTPPTSYTLTDITFINVQLDYRGQSYTICLSTYSHFFYIVNNRLNALFFKYYLTNILKVPWNTDEPFEYSVSVLDHNINLITFGQDTELIFHPSHYELVPVFKEPEPLTKEEELKEEKEEPTMTKEEPTTKDKEEDTFLCI